MKEIKIYHSVWRMSLMIMICVAFVIVFYAILQETALSSFQKSFAWCGIIFFGLGALLMLFGLLRERLTGRPFLTISDEGIVCNGAWKWIEIRFAEVERFELLAGRQNNMIGIHYKADVELRKLADANIVARLARRFNLRTSGAQESISVSGVSVKAKELCEVLNERLANVHRLS